MNTLGGNARILPERSLLGGLVLLGLNLLGLGLLAGNALLSVVRRIMSASIIDNVINNAALSHYGPEQPVVPTLNNLFSHERECEGLSEQVSEQMSATERVNGVSSAEQAECGV